MILGVAGKDDSFGAGRIALGPPATCQHRVADDHRGLSNRAPCSRPLRAPGRAHRQHRRSPTGGAAMRHGRDELRRHRLGGRLDVRAAYRRRRHDDPRQGDGLERRSAGLTAESAATGLISGPTAEYRRRHRRRRHWRRHWRWRRRLGSCRSVHLTGSAEPVSVPVGGTLTWRLRVLDDKKTTGRRRAPSSTSSCRPGSRSSRRRPTAARAVRRPEGRSFAATSTGFRRMPLRQRDTGHECDRGG